MTEAERSHQVARAADGDADALQRLLVEYHDALHRLVDGAIDSSLRRRIEPEDVLQDAYVAAFRALKPAARRSDADEGACTSSDRGVAGAANENPGAVTPERPRFDGAAHFYKWLERIVLNKVREVARGARRQKRNIAREVAARSQTTTSYPELLQRITGTGTTPSRAATRRESIGALLTSLARLSDEQRAAVRLRFLEDVSVAEIAARLGKTETAVYTLCARGLKALRERLESLAL